MIEALDKTRNEAAVLRGKVESLENQIEIKNRQIDTLKAKIEGMGLSEALSGGQGGQSNALAKERIDSLCSQIHECIALLKQ